MVSCSKCYSNDIDALAWINLVTNEITVREDKYHCNFCGAHVEVVITPDMDWITDVEPLKEDENEESQIIPNVSKSNKLVDDQ